MGAAVSLKRFPRLDLEPPATIRCEEASPRFAVVNIDTMQCGDTSYNEIIINYNINYNKYIRRVD